ncbi:helix-turn-helix domain-containing protein [Roseomonas marmotae]|uniref:helix-turn-helix domain-containing protein n=1 Tax=Roseomonas marmotae TaxID=2768161 RepID=UPI001A972311|nr:XRE family transcriptional regulator [Roseomonas marmotae]
MAKTQPQHAAESKQDLGPGIGPKLRMRRNIRRISLQEVADAAGVSIGFLSEVERGLATPTLRSLRAICGALEMPVGWLFEGTGGVEEGVVVRKDNRRRMELGPGGLTKELLSPDAVSALQMMRIVIEPKGTSGKNEATLQAGAKCGTVLAGRLGIEIDGREYALDPGDSFAFSASAALRFWCIGDEPTELIWVVAPAMY